MNKVKLTSYALLHLLFLLYSLVAVFSKLVSGTALFSLEFFACFGAVFILLAVYAVLWQQLLKKMPLTTAFANKGAVVIWGMLWGALIFNEGITLPMLIGAILICVGIVLASGDE